MPMLRQKLHVQIEDPCFCHFLPCAFFFLLSPFFFLSSACLSIFRLDCSDIEQLTTVTTSPQLRRLSPPSMHFVHYFMADPQPFSTFTCLDPACIVLIGLLTGLGCSYPAIAVVMVFSCIITPTIDLLLSTRRCDQQVLLGCRFNAKDVQKRGGGQGPKRIVDADFPRPSRSRNRLRGIGGDSFS